VPRCSGESAGYAPLASSGDASAASTARPLRPRLASGAGPPTVAGVIDARAAVRDALALAAVTRDGLAWAVVAQAETLPGDPTERFAAQAGRGRILLWRGGGWLLAVGAAAEARADGPGRHMAMAEAAASWQGRCVVRAPPGLDDLPCLVHAVAFDDAPAGGAWSSLPGARLILPGRLWWRDEGGCGWRIDAVAVRAGDDAVALVERLERGPDPAPTAQPAAWDALPVDFIAQVEDAAALIRDGALRKVVLARAVDIEVAMDPVAALRRLGASGDAETTLYAADLVDGACFVGATPELLFSADGASVRTMALAGSCRRGGDAAEDRALGQALFDSTKERKEHQLVVEHLVTVLRPRCAPFALPRSPELRVLPRLIHLQTPLAVELLRADYAELLGALHPTPAVCGLPGPTALSWVARHERLRRGLYAGVLGWSTRRRCRFVVPLRGGVLRGPRARLFAGAGIVETSDPQAEFAETEMKLQAMRQALA
jgi:salicylate biosynthesis isochorismate synthase